MFERLFTVMRNYRRPTIWIVAAAVALVGVAGIALAANPGRLPAPEMFTVVDEGEAAWALTGTTVHHSGNGGRSWADVSPELAPGLTIGAADFLDARTGWLLITPPATADEAQPLPVTVLHTTNAGRTWARSSITVSQQARPATVTFIDANHGWAIISYGAACGSEGVEVFSTADGGANWTFCAGAMPPTEHGLPFGGIKSGLSFRDSNTGWLTGYDASDRPYIFITHDGGGTWARQSLPIPQGLSAEGGSSAPRPPVFFAGQAAILPVTFSDKLVLYSSADAGATWTPTATTIGNVWSVITVTDAYATDGTTIVRTADGGRSWATVEPGEQLTGMLAAGYTIRQLDFSAPLKGWALLAAPESGSTQLLKTIDGGRTWR
jgi:photosystem II stability/assembly factor-like uncharacterized protein